MGKNECNDFRLNYRHNFKNVIIAEDSEELYNNLKNINKLKKFERPDMFLINNDIIMGIEEFEFTAYNTNRKGNAVKRKIEENYKRNEDIFLNNKSNYIYDEQIIDDKKSIEIYVKNFKKVFDEHYKNVDKYLKNLSQSSPKLQNTKIYFLIIDTTVEVNEINYENKNIVYNPIMNKEILTFLKDKEKINGIIFQCNNLEKINYYLLEFKKNNLDELLKKSEKYVGCELEQREVKMLNYFGKEVI